MHLQRQRQPLAALNDLGNQGSQVKGWRAVLKGVSRKKLPCQASFQQLYLADGITPLAKQMPLRDVKTTRLLGCRYRRGGNSMFN